MDKILQKKRSNVISRQTRKERLTDDKICQYLLRHPDFFIRHAKRLDSLQISHPIRGGISLPEWQMARQRDKIKQLELKIQLLFKQASENELLFEQLIDLQLSLIQSTSLGAMSQSLSEWAHKLGLQGSYLYLFANKWQISPPFNYPHLSIDSLKFDFIRIRHFQYRSYYLGTLSQSESAFLFPDLQSVGSVAISLLGQFGDLGILIFVSRDPLHYQEGQGTLLLEKLSLLLPVLIGRWVQRK